MGDYQPPEKGCMHLDLPISLGVEEILILEDGAKDVLKNIDPHLVEDIQENTLVVEGTLIMIDQIKVSLGIINTSKVQEQLQKLEDAKTMPMVVPLFFKSHLHSPTPTIDFSENFLWPTIVKLSLQNNLGRKGGKHPFKTSITILGINKNPVTMNLGSNITSGNEMGTNCNGSTDLIGVKEQRRGGHNGLRPFSGKINQGLLLSEPLGTENTKGVIHGTVDQKSYMC